MTALHISIHAPIYRYERSCLCAHINRAGSLLLPLFRCEYSLPSHLGFFVRVGLDCSDGSVCMPFVCSRLYYSDIYKP